MERDTRDYYLRIHEKSPTDGYALVVEGVLGLISVAKEALKNPEYLEMYLTECRLCCSEGTSYRLFSDVPEFQEVGIFGHPDTAHPDTGMNREIMIAKCYNEDPGLAGRISRIICSDPKRLDHNDGVPDKSKVFKVK
tara:strand:- start:3987 stop:4397 length:411 start_codon:yes stop_codon:yes gene_type:complete